MIPAIPMLETQFIAAADENSRRLMVVLHGLGDSIAGYQWMPKEMALSWLNYLLVNAPDSYYGGFSWYDFSGEPAPGVERSCRQLFQMLDLLASKGFPTEQTVLFGFSQGCVMTLEVGFRYPQKFAGLVGVSGYVLDPPALLHRLSPVAKQQRMLFTHGTLDSLIPCAQVRQQVAMLKAAGLQIEWKQFAKPHSIAGEAELQVIRDFVRTSFEE
jgi:phospholipase/carboxylesterase